MYTSQTPIDIHCAKLLDWLVQRRHCRKDWGENLAAIRRKIRSALKDMPESEDIKALLVGSKLDYSKSKHILEILKTIEKDSKNIFGFYSSQRMKDWQDIVYSYEKDCIYLAESATDLIRETNYEIPNVRKTIERFKKEKDDAEKLYSKLMRRNQQFNSDYKRLAQSYGIDGVNVADELQEQSANLKYVMDELTLSSKHLEDGLNYYFDFSGRLTKMKSSEFLSALRHVIYQGNTTVWQYKHGTPPEKIEPKKTAASTSSGGNHLEIELVNDDIDFGEDVPSSSESSSGFVHLEGKNDSAFVDIEQVICEPIDKIARGDDAKLVLENRRTHYEFINNLFELDAFFKQLNVEELDEKERGKYLDIIKNMIDLSERNRVLLQINDCPSFIDDINEKFSTKLKQANDSLSKAAVAQERIKDLDKQIKETEKHYRKKSMLAKRLQIEVEDSITKLYGGRKINIMGCVNETSSL